MCVSSRPLSQSLKVQGVDLGWAVLLPHLTVQGVDLGWAALHVEKYSGLCCLDRSAASGRGATAQGVSRTLVDSPLVGCAQATVIKALDEVARHEAKIQSKAAAAAAAAVAVAVPKPAPRKQRGAKGHGAGGPAG